MRILRTRDRIARPWKNGGGVTYDIAVYPEGATDEDFLWRASIATIAAAGPFSAFPDIDRTFLLLDGVLQIEIGGRAQHLREGSAALQFSGEEAVSAAPEAGHCTALNILVRRGRVSAKVERRRTMPQSVADALLLIVEQEMTISVGNESSSLGAHDGLLLGRPCPPPAFDNQLIAVELFGDQLVQ